MSTHSVSAPLRILCIHGYRQNSGTFRDKTGALRKLLKKQAELVYISAPHRVTLSAEIEQDQEKKNEAKDEEDPRGWWFSDIQARTFHAGQVCEASLGLEESFETVKTAIREQGPFDGILGFSQGAALVAMLCALQEQQLAPELKFRFAILVAGFPSVCAQHERFYTGVTLTTPSLHVFGQTDGVIPDTMSRELLLKFKDPQVLIHPGGTLYQRPPPTGRLTRNSLRGSRAEYGAKFDFVENDLSTSTRRPAQADQIIKLM